MRVPTLVGILALLSSSSALAESKRPVHTYSIVARDAATGEIGVAVQSHWFSVGSLVTWAEPGVGAVATQSFVDPAYGPLGLELMRTGKTAPETLASLLAGDSKREVRQVAMIDAQGNVAAHTGTKCIAAAGHTTGKNFSVQANIMANETVWPAMAAAFEKTKGDLAARMLAALEAAERAGGDLRGRQSAAMIVVSGKRTGRSWERIIDVRVDDHEQPLDELRRLIDLNRAYNHMNAGDAAMERNDFKAARRAYETAAKMQPGIHELVYWHAVALAGAGQVDASLPLFKRVFAAEERWIELTRRLAPAGLLPDDPKLLERILAQAPAAKPAAPAK
jgi:uncharacterized Ntn-hydrolase superfamily protein